jgi:CheY-like chemotaxis protein
MQMGSLENMKFLVVDDNQFMRRIIKTILAAFHCRNVKEAGDGAEALRLLSSGYFPDILITNWQMPMIDGIDLARMVRTGSDSRDPYVPIIMVTGHSEHNRIIEARDAGVNEILVKPISARTLTTRIFSVINNPRPFVRSSHYFGPDRRRRVDPSYRGPERRKGDKD